jgi:hypothetical protein
MGQSRVLNTATTNLTRANTIEIGVAGRSEAERVISSALEPRLMSVLLSHALSGEIVRALANKGFVIVPRSPTKEMLEEGWYEATNENARGVWVCMLEAYESSGKSATDSD